MTLVEPEVVAIAGATASVYRQAPSWQGRRTAAVGSFACDRAAAGGQLLRDIAARLSAEGFEALIGPMDGDTWHKYRVVSTSDGSRPYFLEPVSGSHDLEAFRNAAFAPISSYVSARASIDEALAEPAPPVAGVTISAWDGADAGRLIGGLFDMSSHAFANNAFYKPITREAFLALYQPILPAIDPRLVFFARQAEGRLVGFMFALPDHLEGAEIKTGIIKTYASAVPGVGRMLVDAAHGEMRRQGFKNVIHALMHVDNRSRQRSLSHHGKVFRRYDLMGLDLEQRAA